MNPSKVARSRVKKLTDLPNIGPAGAEDLRLLGIREPSELIGRRPFEMYERLCEITGSRQDRCVIDVFTAVTRFVSGQEPRRWWTFTKERKQIEARKRSARKTVKKQPHRPVEFGNCS